MTRQRYRQLRRAVEQGRKIAGVIFRPFTDEEQADYERRMDARDDAYDDTTVPEVDEEPDDDEGEDE